MDTLLYAATSVAFRWAGVVARLCKPQTAKYTPQKRNRDANLLTGGLMDSVTGLKTLQNGNNEKYKKFTSKHSN